MQQALAVMQDGRHYSPVLLARVLRIDRKTAQRVLRALARRRKILRPITGIYRALPSQRELFTERNRCKP